MKRKPPPMSVIHPEFPSECGADVLRAAAVGLVPFIDLARLALKQRPETYERACQLIQSGEALESIIVTIRDDSMSLCLALADPDAPAPSPLFAVSGKGLSGLAH